MASSGGGGNFNLNPVQSTTVEGKLDIFKITFKTKINFKSYFLCSLFVANKA
jgi:hypothetical protein